MSKSDEIQSILTDLHRADLAWREAKRTIHRQKRIEADQAILAFKIERDKIAARARDHGGTDAGASFPKIGEAIGSKDGGTQREAVNSGRRFLAPKTTRLSAADRFEFDGQVLAITLDLADVEGILEYTAFSREVVEATPSLLTCKFERIDGAWVLVDGEEMNPVASLFFGPAGESLRAEAEALVA